jgi:hypothetical protein
MQMLDRPLLLCALMAIVAASRCAGGSVTAVGSARLAAGSLFLRGGGDADFRAKLPPELVAEYDRLHGGAPQKRVSWPADWYPTKDDPVEGSVKVTFEYMTDFIKDTFEAYGVPSDEAALAADVLIEADKRGISSHGIGRLKPIYCDRLDANILRASAPLTTERDVGATALVNGNLGLGLVVGPRCMEMAIAKAKKYGIGCVIAKNSTHYGIAGYYATMATKAGCVGVSDSPCSLPAGLQASFLPISHCGIFPCPCTSPPPLAAVCYDQRAPLDSTHFRGAGHDGHQPPLLRHPHRRGIPVCD